MSIQATALAKALSLLKIAGVVHAVVTPDNGVVITEGYELRVIPAPKSKVPGDATKTVTRGTYSRVYAPVIDAMAPGDVHVFDVPPEIARIDWFQASVGSYANRKWGASSYLTETDSTARTLTLARII